MDDLNAIRLRQSVFDLQELDKRQEGILSPGYSAEELDQHVHEVFLEHAHKFLAFCPIDRESIEYWKGIIRDAFGDYSPQKIVDIGSGGGTTVFPLLELFPSAHLIATDLALPLLAELRNRAQKDGYKELDVLQMNAERMVFADCQADLVIGANVLHHALCLEKMFQEIRRILLPGAKAVFWEPFENGAQLLACVFDLWDETNPHQTERFAEDVMWSLRGYTADLKRRAGRKKPMEVLAQLDDKWFFTRAHVHHLAVQTGFAACEIRNIFADFLEPLETMTDHELRRKGHAWTDIPLWAKDKLRSLQARCSRDFMAENPFCCSIVLTA